MPKEIYNGKPIDQVKLLTPEIEQRMRFRMECVDPMDAKYGEKVSVYKISNYSVEICAGPHVKNTKDIGHFKIIKEEAVAAGIRRIKAVLE